MQRRPKVYVTRILPKQAMDKIDSYCDAEVWDGELEPPRDILLEKVRNAEGLVSLVTDRIDAELIDRAVKLKVISNYAVGVDNVDVKAATSRGIFVGNTPGVLTETTADFAFALIMSAARRVVEADKSVRAGHWKTWEPMVLLGQDIYGSTLGIIGLGRIGSAVAKRAKGFGMRILYYDINRQSKTEEELGIEWADMEKILVESDFITLHTNLSPLSYHLIGAEEFKMMRRNCILINTSRGSVVDNMALYEALRDGRIAYAALDVTEPEPIPVNHPLLQLSNVIITPHIASASVATRTKMALMAAENLIAGLKGMLPPNPANPEVLRSH